MREERNHGGKGIRNERHDDLHPPDERRSENDQGQDGQQGRSEIVRKAQNKRNELHFDHHADEEHGVTEEKGGCGKQKYEQ